MPFLSGLAVGLGVVSGGLTAHEYLQSEGGVISAGKFVSLARRSRRLAGYAFGQRGFVVVTVWEYSERAGHVLRHQSAGDAGWSASRPPSASKADERA